jgi:hypothetical protein
MMQVGADPPVRRWRANAAWITFAAYILFVALGSNLLEIRYSYFNPEVGGSWGMIFAPDGADVRVQSVEPGSRAAALGISTGDLLRPSNRFVFRQIPVAGETLHFVRVSPGVATPMTLLVNRATTPPMAVPNRLDRLLDDSVRILICLGGIFILWRGRSRSSFLLGLGLIALMPFPANWLPLTPLPFGMWNAGVDTLFYLGQLALPLFAMAFLTEAQIRVPPWAKQAFWLAFTVAAVTFAVDLVFPPGLFPSWVYFVDRSLIVPSGLSPFALAIGILTVGWRRGTAESRHRVVLLLLALSLILLSNSLFIVFDTSSKANPRALTAVSSVCRMSGSLLFVYAILRHRVIDVGFTLNRTLVYGGVSAILLAAFALLEWGLHQVLALEGWEGGALLSAGLAVAVFLAFHPVRRFVEHYVSTIFFRPWRNKEQALRKFVHEAGFFKDAARLGAAFSDALERFSGVPCCVYRVADDGSYICATGKMPTAHADDAVAVALRARGEPCDIEGATTAIDGAHAFPMMHGHDLEGFAVLGRKLEGERYRPDEIELIEWASRQLGLDLFALSVDQLKGEREERDRNIAVLTGRIGELQGALSSRLVPASRRRLPTKAVAAQ